MWDGWVSPGRSLSLVPSTEPDCQPCSCPSSPRSTGLRSTGPWRTNRRARGDLQLQPWGRRWRNAGAGVRVGRWPFLGLVSASPSLAQGRREGPLSCRVSSALGSFLTMFRTLSCPPSPGNVLGASWESAPGRKCSLNLGGLGSRAPRHIPGIPKEDQVRLCGRAPFWSGSLTIRLPGEASGGDTEAKLTFSSSPLIPGGR